MNLLLALLLLAQAPDRDRADYMLLPAEAPKVAKTAVKVVLPSSQSLPLPVQSLPQSMGAPVGGSVLEWHKIIKPEFYATDWVWGYKNEANHIVWYVGDQENAWKKLRMTQPVWKMEDACGYVWAHPNRDVLEKFVQDKNGCAVKSESEPVVRAVSLPLPLPMLREVPMDYSTVVAQPVQSLVVPISSSVMPSYTMPFSIIRGRLFGGGRTYCDSSGCYRY